MRARRDQVQAYKFVTRRIVAAMLSGEPETTERPMRRLGLSVFASSMVAALGMAAFGVWGLVTGQTDELGDDDLLVLEEGTRGRYVYVDGRLHPVSNIASAYLILGTSEPKVRELPPSELVGLERGPEVGIVGAPDGLPRADDLTDLPWSVCSTPPTADSPEPQTTLLVGQDLPGGSGIGSTGIYVSVGEERYLVWSNRLLRLAHSVTPVVLGLSAAEPVQIGLPLANAITSGPDLDVVVPAGLDEETTTVIGDQRSRVGHIYFTAGQHYVMTRDGLRPLGELTVALRTSIDVAEIRDITGVEVSEHLHSNEPLEPEGYPPEVPEIHPVAGRSTTVCAVYRGPSNEGPASTVEVHATVPDLLSSSSGVVELRQTDRDEVPVPGTMRIAAGRAALVQEASTTGESLLGTTFLIHPNGVRYPIGNDGALDALGYGGVQPIPVPAELLAMVPRGPGLVIADAQAVAEELAEDDNR